MTLSKHETASVTEVPMSKHAEALLVLRRMYKDNPVLVEIVRTALTEDEPLFISMAGITEAKKYITDLHDLEVTAELDLELKGRK